MCQDIYNSYDLFNHPGVGDKTSALYAASTARHSIFPGILSYASFLTSPPRTVGTSEAKIDGTLCGELTNVVPFKSLVSVRTWPCVLRPLPGLFSRFHLIYSSSLFFFFSFSKSYPYFLSALAVANAVSRVVRRNKIGHRSCSHKQLMQVPKPSLVHHNSG